MHTVPTVFMMMVIIRMRSVMFRVMLRLWLMVRMNMMLISVIILMLMVLRNSIDIGEIQLPGLSIILIQHAGEADESEQEARRDVLRDPDVEEAIDELREQTRQQTRSLSSMT